MSEVNNIEIPDFLADLAKATAPRQSHRKSTESEIKVLNMKSKNNWGKADLVPVNGPDKADTAFKQLNRVARVEKWVSGTKKDGTEYGFVQRLHFFLDPKYYGELTDEQAKQLDRIKSKFNQVNGNSQSVSIHHLTLIQGILLSLTNKENPPKVIYETIPALCIYESKNFEKAVNAEFNNLTDNMGSYAWAQQLCSRDEIRKRFFSIDFYLNQTEGAGFQASVKVNKFDEDTAKKAFGKTDGLHMSDCGDNIVEKFKNPIKTYLGIPQDGPIFNEEYMNDIEVVLNQLIKGETPVETRQQPKGEPEKPNSNEGFKAQDENAEIPTSVVDTTSNGEPAVQHESTDPAF